MFGPVVLVIAWYVLIKQDNNVPSIETCNKREELGGGTLPINSNSEITSQQES